MLISIGGKTLLLSSVSLELAPPRRLTTRRWKEDLVAGSRLTIFASKSPFFHFSIHPNHIFLKPSPLLFFHEKFSICTKNLGLEDKCDWSKSRFTNDLTLGDIGLLEGGNKKFGEFWLRAQNCQLLRSFVKRQKLEST